MRDPNLTEPRSANDLRVKPPHGRQTRVALGLEANSEDTGTPNSYVNISTSATNSHKYSSNDRAARGDRQDSDYAITHQNGMAPSPARETVQQPSQQTISGRPQPLQRARSDFGPRRRGERNAAVVEEDLWRMRHGWEDEYTSNEYLALLNSVSITYPS
jgi:hypothetical protein